jgi:Tol biopolymer transport system component
VRISPDGQRIASHVSDQENDIWIWDVSRRTFARLTSGLTVEQNPIWTPDGRRIAYSSAKLGKQNLYWQAADGTERAERLTTSANPQVPLTFTPDGKSLLFRENDPVSGIAAGSPLRFPETILHISSGIRVITLGGVG